MNKTILRYNRWRKQISEQATENREHFAACRLVELQKKYDQLIEASQSAVDWFGKSTLEAASMNGTDCRLPADILLEISAALAACPDDAAGSDGD